MANTSISGAWFAKEALRTVVNRGFSYSSIRVWFIGDTWAECRFNRPGMLGHLEVLCPVRPSCDMEIVKAREFLRLRVNDALDRQLGLCL